VSFSLRTDCKDKKDFLNFQNVLLEKLKKTPNHLQARSFYVISPVDNGMSEETDEVVRHDNKEVHASVAQKSWEENLSAEKSYLISLILFSESV